MTQPVLFATPDSDMAPVTEGAVVASALKKDSSRKSAIVQRLFEIAALERGYELSVNIECGKDFDVIIRLPGGRPVVIQVKAACWDVRGFYKISNSSRVTGIYSSSAYDVLAVYLQDRKQWLFYFRAELGNRTSTTYTPRDLRQRPRRSFSGSHGEVVADRDPDNWSLIDQVAASKINSGHRTADV
jgi:hypothetical protein